MIDHIGIKVRDVATSRAFYKQVLAELGYDQVMEAGGGVGFGPADTRKPVFWISQGAPSPVHVCFRAAARETVDGFHRAGLAAGGKDNGKPGLRPHYHDTYYGAFVTDPDGYNVEAMTTSAS